MCQPGSLRPDSAVASNLYISERESMLAGKPLKIKLDYLNERIKVVSYHTENIGLLTDYLYNLARGIFGKVIIVAREEDWQEFLSRGYILEGINKGYHQGCPGYYMARFFKKERGIRDTLIEEDRILQDVLRHPIEPGPSRPPAGYILRDAVSEDISQMALLYDRVFRSYPSPITKPGYLRQLIGKYPFKVMEHRDMIVCAASAETDRENRTAELTDCACLPEFRSQGLMSSMVYTLEQELIQSGFKNLYTIGRARSHGINAIFRKLGYAYGGRFINNCTICGQFEDMNLWYKNTGS